MVDNTLEKNNMAKSTVNMAVNMKIKVVLQKGEKEHDLQDLGT